jgi:hypothetical protein
MQLKFMYVGSSKDNTKVAFDIRDVKSITEFPDREVSPGVNVSASTQVNLTDGTARILEAGQCEAIMGFARSLETVAHPAS